MSPFTYVADPALQAEVNRRIAVEARLRVREVRRRGGDIVERMAERIREIGMSGTPVTADALFDHSDFTRLEIERYGREAADLARIRAVREVA